MAGHRYAVAVIAACACFEASGFGARSPRPLARSVARSARAWDVHVEERGEVTRLRVVEGESVLAARERRGASGRPHSDCQRGECFSCAGRLLPNSTGAFTISQPGGLETRLPDRAADADFVLACSMFITGPGVRVEFADEHVSAVWEALTAGFGDDAPGPAQGKGAVAAARTIRKYQEENLDEFVESIERVWERGDGEFPGR